MDFLFFGLFAVILGVLLIKRKTRQLLLHPVESMNLVYFLAIYKPHKFDFSGPEEEYCFNVLTKVSRSFASVIKELDPELRTPVCIFYLVLRALDTVEDDMSIPLEKKIPMLKNFSNKLLESGWNSQEGYGSANPHEQQLLEQFHDVITVFGQQKKPYRDTIQDICKKMADGMSEFAQRDVKTHEDYELYCHYVAGLVGEGLSSLFNSSGLEGKRFQDLEELSNSMGLFLQKTNIIRDYLEDIEEDPPRIFYPEEVWSRYTDAIENFKDPKYKKEALKCLNDMVTDATKHIEDVIEYMSKIENDTIFKFCGIPQVMAIATLELVYNNYNVFKKEVKIRKGEAVTLIMNTKTFSGFCKTFLEYISKFEKKIDHSDPNAKRLQDNLSKGRKAILLKMKN